MPKGIYKRKEETKNNLSFIKKGKHFSINTEFKKGYNGSIREKNGMFGKHHSEETIQKIIESRKGYKHSEETKIKISNSNKGIPKSKEAIIKYKEFRNNQIIPKKDTSIELKIQNYLKQLNIEFLTHQYIKDIEHGYQCDILIPVQEGIYKKTIIECFGTYWHNYPLSREIDIKRCIELREKGYRVLVFWENEIKVMELNDLRKELQQQNEY